MSDPDLPNFRQRGNNLLRRDHPTPTNGNVVMKRLIYCFFATGVIALAFLCPAEAFAGPALGEKVEIFKAAGFKRSVNGEYVKCDEDVFSPAFQAGQIKLTDLNGDNRPEAWVTESSTYCYGDTGQYFVLLTKDVSGWHKVLEDIGIASVLKTRHRGWPDIEVGGPGFGKFPVYRWNGKTYNCAPHCSNSRQ
jgi:hypothetical protein